ncbi:MAG: TGS domain-containing protein [Porphyromonas sp.]|nr:TGS domain-containing protein [Porphyromonas sp.]
MIQQPQYQAILYTALRALVARLATETSREERKQLFRLLGSEALSNIFARKDEDKHIQIPSLISTLETARVASEELYLDRDSLIALLLYIPYSEGLITDKTAEQCYGIEVQRLLSLMQRASALYSRRESISSENFHNLLLSMAEDIRVVLLIIADRLYRLRHAKKLYNSEGCLALAVEASFLYAPIAHRLGLYKIKGEMEDLCLKWRDRKTYDYIVRKLGESKASRDAFIAAFISPIRKRLEEVLDVPFEMKGRTKSISSIHNKLRKQAFEDIYDLFAIRIIVDCPVERERLVCWQVYSIIADMYRPNPERLKDWISIPKSNGYESLHTTVMGPESRWVEVQIRSQRMDAIAEQGVAAHWKYKGIKSEGGLDEFLASVRDTLEAVKAHDGADRRGILERSMMTIKAQEIYVFTPKGEVMKLPKGATVLDFAFSVHSRVGASAILGKVNGKNVSLKHQLSNGDTVEIITSAQQSPKQDWLSVVVSTKAKARIRQLLRAEEEQGLAIAKELVQRRLKNRKLPYNEAVFIRLTIRRGYKALSDFYRDIKHEKLDVSAFIDQYEQELRQIASEAQSRIDNIQTIRSAETFTGLSELAEVQANTATSQEVLVIDQGLTGVVYSFAKCCQPVYGDEVFGFVSSKGIKIHRTDCPNAPDMIERTGHRVLSARWSGNDSERSSLVQIEVVGRDDIAVVTHIISLIKKESRCMLRNYSIDSGDGLFRGTFVIKLEQGSSLSNLVKKVRSAVGVKQVIRH